MSLIWIGSQRQKINSSIARLLLYREGGKSSICFIYHILHLLSIDLVNISFFFFPGSHQWHMEVPRLWVESEV